MKRIFLPGIFLAILMAACIVTWAEAAPAAPIDRIISQPDGTTFIGRLWGDEWQNGYETREGYTILQLDNGWWVYAGSIEAGKLQPAMRADQYLVVGLAEPDGLVLHLRPEKVISPTSMHSIFVQDETKTPNTGSQPVLVLLAQFTNRAGTYTAANFASSMFGVSNSVKDFYLDASFNQLNLAAASETHGTTNDGVVGWLSLNMNHPDTRDNLTTANQTIVKNALIAADSYVNYASYDLDGNGYISNKELHIVVVVAGFEYSYGDGSIPAIWAHRWSLNGVTPPVLDGKILGDFNYDGGYAQFGEIHQDHQATIGIMAHELGHDLSWPDLYDVDNSSEGVGEWSIMGSGSWNYVTIWGDSPAMPDAWLKWYQGWITPTSVNGTLPGAAIPQAETNASAYLLRPNPGGVDWNFEVASGSGEYFLVENRQKTGYDTGLPGCGLLIWHIDEAVTNTNDANANEFHPLVKLVEADGLNHLVTATNRGDTGDPYPGSTNNRSFTYSTTPNSRLYNGMDSLVTVTNISATCAATMTADLAYTGTVTPVHTQFLPVIMGGRVIQSVVLWDQPASTVNLDVYADQQFPDAPTYSIYQADDFLVGSSGWNVKELFIPGGLFSSGTSLALATQLKFQIYTDNAGIPAGDPVNGGAFWSISLTPGDAQISLLTGSDGLPSNVRLTLTTPAFLPAGRYWFVFYPVMPYSTAGQYGRLVSDTANGFDAVVMNPGGGFGFPLTWTSIQDANTWSMVQQDLAFQIKGN
jgi:M6 family metalloprotease-like protein